MYKVVIADDHCIVREGLHILLNSCRGYEVAGEATNGNEAISQSLALVPDLLLTDLKMPGTSIIEGAKTLKIRHPQMKIIILTAVDESEDIYRAFNAGIDGYLMKDTSPEVILSTIEDVMKGASIFQPKENNSDQPDTRRSPL